MEIRRGDLVVMVMPGDYGKPRPALVVQDDAFDSLPSVTVLPLTGDLRNSPLTRITVEPDPSNGLQIRSQIMVDKIGTADRRRVRGIIGRLDLETMRAASAATARFLGIT